MICLGGGGRRAYIGVAPLLEGNAISILLRWVEHIHSDGCRLMVGGVQPAWSHMLRHVTDTFARLFPFHGLLGTNLHVTRVLFFPKMPSL